MGRLGAAARAATGTVGRWARRLLVGCSLLAATGVAYAAPNLTLTTGFVAADGSRTYMDIGGVWDGTQEVTNTTGDTFSLTLNNGGDATAYSLGVDVTLPAYFHYVNGTAAISSSGCATPPALDVVPVTESGALSTGLTLGFNFSGGYDMAAGCQLTLDYGLYADTNVTAGTYQLQPKWRYSLTSGGALEPDHTDQQAILTRAGDFIIIKSLDTGPTGTGGDTEGFTVTALNTGSGGLFDLDVTETLGAGFDAGSLNISAPGSPPGSQLNATTYRFDYLQPNQTVDLTVTATVAGCSDIDNTASAVDRSGQTDSSLASVIYDLQNPDIVFDALGGTSTTPPGISIAYGSVAHVTIPFANNGGGVGYGLTVNTNLENITGLTISNVAAGWDYNATTGVFAYVGSGTVGSPDPFPANTSVPITFDADMAASCPPPTTSATISWEPLYSNTCGASFNTILASSAFSVSGVPTMGITKSVSSSRLNLGQTGNYQIGLTASNTVNLPGNSAGANDDVTVTDTIPTGLTNVSIASIPAGTAVSVNGGGAQTSGPVSLASGDVLTWLLDKEDFPVSNLQLDFTVDAAPVGGCSPATFIDNSASYAYNGCSLSGSANAAFLANESITGVVSQELNISNSASAPFETGLNDSDGVLDNETGEGEAITYVAAHSFGAGTNGTWAGSTFTLFLGTDESPALSTEAVVNGSIQVNVDGAGYVAVPGGNISTGGSGEQIIDLGFLAGVGYANDANIAGHTLDVRYSTTVTDADLNGATSRQFVERVSLDVANGDTGCTGTATYKKGIVVDLVRAAPPLSLSMPSTVDVCQVFPVTLNVGDPGSATTADNLRLEFNTSNYTFVGNTADEGNIANASAVSYGGLLATLDGTGNVDRSLAGAGVRFDLNPQATPFTAAGSASFNVRLDPGYAGTNAAATLAYDDHQTTAALVSDTDRDFSDSASHTPTVRQGNLDLVFSPQKVFLTTDTVEWTMYITNTAPATAYNVAVTDTLPAAFSADTANSSLQPLDSTPASVVNAGGVDTMTWQVGDIAPGATVQITVVAKANGSSCSLNSPAPNHVEVTWGCGGVNVQTLTADSPTIDKPGHDLQVVHNTTNTECNLCGTGTVDIEVKNSGNSHLYNVAVTEDLQSSGLVYKAGTTQVSVNGGGWVSAGDPQSIGTTLVWDAATLLGANASDTLGQTLSDMDTARENTTDELTIRFQVDSPGEAFNSNPRAILASADYDTACGNDTGTNSPGTPFTIPVNRPDITVGKTGWNVDAGQSEADKAATVYAGSGDQIVWRIEVNNSGPVVAEDMFFRDYIGGNFTLDSYCEQTPPADYGTCSFTALGGSVDEKVTIPDIPAGANRVFYVRGTVQSACTDQTNTGEVEWGCPVEPPAGGLTTPTKNSDTAALVVQPAISPTLNVNQTITDLAGNPRPDTNGIVSIGVTNGGGNARNLVLTDTLPSGYIIDTTYTATVSSNGTYTGAIDTVAVNSTTPGVPVFTLTSSGGSGVQSNLLRYGDTATVTFRIVQNSGFDTTADVDTRTETVANGFDPTVPADGTNSVKVDFDDTCVGTYTSTATQGVQPQTPDLDVDISDPITRLVNNVADTSTFDVVVTNNGEDTAANGVLTITIGGGWSGTAPALCGGTAISAGSTTVLNCNLPSIAATASTTVSFPLSVANDTQSLAFQADVEGNIQTQDGVDTTNNYSLDSIRARVLGFRVSKALQSCTEADSTDPDVWVGEQCTYRVTGVWFGSGADTISGVQVDDVLDSGLSYVSDTPTGSNTVTINSGPTAGDTGTLSWAIADFNAGAGAATFQTDVVTRVLNDPLNSDGSPVDHGTTLKDTAAAAFTFQGNAFGTSSSGYSAVGARQSSVTVKTPQLTITKLVCNETALGHACAYPGDFAATVTGDAGDDFVYHLTVSNASGRGTAYDLAVTDTVPSKLGIAAFASDGLDNDGDGNTDSGNEGGVASQVITFDSSTADNTGLVSLAAGASIDLTYRVTASAAVNPNEVLTNSAQVAYDTLPGASGTGSYSGTSGGADGARQYSASVATAPTITIYNIISVGKSIVTTSVGADTATDVLVGEQITYRLEVTLPQGTVNTMKVTDQLPQGLALVDNGVGSTSFGAAVSCANAPPTVTPAAASLPASGTPLNITWDFGNCSVALTGARTITIDYVAQVRNIAGNVEGQTLANNAAYSHSTSSGAVGSATVTVREPQLSVTKVVKRGATAVSDASTSSRIDAGDQLTVEITVQNTGTVSAYDLSVTDLVNDNGVYSGADGNVDTASAYGSVSRDIAVFDCAAGATGISTGGSFNNGDGDGDTTDEADDCAVTFSEAELAGGASKTYSFTMTAADSLVINNQNLNSANNSGADVGYINATAVSGQSLPSGTSGDGNSSYERSGASDPSGAGRFAASDSYDLYTQRQQTPGKTITAHSDANTPITELTPGETYSADLTFNMREGLSRGVDLVDRVRLLDGGTPVGDGQVTLVAATLARNSTSLSAGNDPGFVNATAINTPVDVSGLISQGSSGGYRTFTLNLGDVSNTLATDGPGSGSDATYTLSLQLRLQDQVTNLDGHTLADQPRILRYDGKDASLGYLGGTTRSLALVEPSVTLSKSSADADGLISAGESAAFTLQACNGGTSPAYDVVVQDVLPDGMRGAGLTVTGITINGVAPGVAPIYTWDATTGTATWSFDDADWLAAVSAAPNNCISIDYTASADADLAEALSLTNRSNVTLYYSQPSTVTSDRRQYPASPEASATLTSPGLHWRPDHDQTTQAGTTVIYPHRLDLFPGSGSGTLDITVSSDQGVQWVLYQDANDNGQLDSTDPAWVNGSTPSFSSRQFFLKGYIPVDTPPQWLDTTTLQADYTVGGNTYSRTVTDVTRINEGGAGEVSGSKEMALDTNCDGNLGDESVADAQFAVHKSVTPGDCVRFRIRFRNEGTGPVTEVTVRDTTPSYTTYRGSSAQYESTPSGLSAGTITAPADGGTGDLAWPFSGSLNPGAEGSVLYDVQVDQ